MGRIAWRTACADLPSLETLIDAEPSPTAMITPPGSTVATEGSEVANDTARFTSRPSVSRMVTCIVAEVPITIESGISTTIDETGSGCGVTKGSVVSVPEQAIAMALNEIRNRRMFAPDGID
jgi:hypothetical protein